MDTQTTDLAARKSIVVCDALALPAGEWPQAALICGGLGIILGLYDQSPEVEVTVHGSGDQEGGFSISLVVDRASSVNGYVGKITESLGSKLPNGNDPWSLELKAVLDQEERGNSTPVSVWFRCIFEEASPASLSATFEKSPSYDPTAFVKRLLSQISHATEQLAQYQYGACGSTNTLIRDVHLLSNTDERDIRRWTPFPPAPVTPSSSCVHALVEKQVAKTPDATAIHSWDGKLTYRELNELSSHLAARLISMPELSKRKSVIPLLFEKSRWAVVAMLAVLKSGHAFLLLDASHPTGRLELLVQQVQGSVILASETQEERAAVLVPAVLVVSEASTTENPAALQVEDDIEVATGTGPHDLALIVFTSGTTGRPKATAIEHHSICWGLMGLAAQIGVSETCRYYQFSSYAWDAAFGEMLMTLFCGGCICIPSEEDRMDRLAQSMTELDANFVLLTPTVLRLLSPEDVPTMKNIIMGGEKVTRSLVETWASRVNLTTVYAPAECTVACMVNQQFGREFDPALIGSAFGCRVWIAMADDIDRLAPVGVAGELLIEGPNVAQGYLNDAERTAKCFLTAAPRWMRELQLDPIPYSRIYRTGDLARYNPDGKIVFIGRRDLQVKLRGQRIELHEIQTQIQMRMQMPGAQVFVDVVDLGGNQQLPSLAAFVHVPGHQQQSENKEHQQAWLASEFDKIRLEIAKVLPGFMVPTLWIPTPVVQLSSSGKLDRRALVQFGKDYLSKLQTSPRETEDMTETQQQLSQLWAQLLSPPQHPGLRDDFFLLGGDSVKAMQLVSLARQQAKLKLSVKDIFQHSTLAAMSLVAEKEIAQSNGTHEKTSQTLTILSRDDISVSLAYLSKKGYQSDDVVDIFPCTQLQEAMFSSSQGVSGSYISQYVFSLGPDLNMTEKVKKAWENTIAAIPILRAIFLPSRTGHNQAILREPSLQWNTAFQTIDTYLESDRQRPFGLGEPLARYCVVEDSALSSGQSQLHLVWTLHHSIFDGWSLDKILEQLQRQMQGVVIDHGSEGKELDGDFSKFVDFTQRVDTPEARTFWQQQLLDAPAPSFPAILAKFGETHHIIADRSCVEQVVDASHVQVTKPGVTITILARAALAILLSHYENSEDVIFGNTVHGRNSLPSELHNVIGPTLATLPVRIKVNRRQAVKYFLGDLQEQFIAAMPHEQFGLMRIRDMDTTNRSSSSFRVLLIVQNPDSTVLNGLQGREAFRCLHEYPLVITITPDSNQSQMNMSWTFDDTLLGEDQVRAFGIQCAQTLSQLCSVGSEDASTRICDLDLASQLDKTRFLEWNSVHHQPVRTSALELLRGQIRQNPLALAIDAWDGVLSYEALDHVSDVFAAELVRLGVGPNTLVGHCFEKSLWAAVALVAIIKAGGAFAPFSPGYPRERLHMFTHDAGIKIILCSSQQRQILSEQGPWKILVVDDGAVDQLRPLEGSGVLPASVSPDSLIYALQTSGTTGQPKTFTVTHTAFATGMVTRDAVISRGSGQRVLQFGPYTFRLGIENILATLATGGCICIPSENTIMNDLSGYMGEARVTFANATPSVARTLEPNKMPDLRVLLVSGEPPDRHLIATWANTHVQLVNGYGPSEFTAKQTLNPAMTENDPQNLGRALGARLWVVDPENHQRLTPLGAVGELLIESPTLAEGYINRPAETEKRFISPPEWHDGFRSEVQITLFKSGDLVRYNLDGTLTSVGRADGQVKLHGQRFEAKEVEHHIKNFYMGFVSDSTQLAVNADDRHLDTENNTPLAINGNMNLDGDEGYMELAVKANGDIHIVNENNMDPAINGNDTHLDNKKNMELDVLVDILDLQSDQVVVAFLAPKKHKLQSATSIELDTVLGERIQSEKRQMTEYLSRFLPGYMIPRTFLAVSLVPVTMNGKVDRRALKAFFASLSPEIIYHHRNNTRDGESDLKAAVRPPRSNAEKTLHALWQQVLRLQPDQFGIDDHFFELGGSSMTAIRLVAKARDEAQVLLVAQSIFRFPVLRDMALQLGSLADKDTSHSQCGVASSMNTPRFHLVQDMTGCSSKELIDQLSVHGLSEKDIEDAYPCVDLQAFYMRKAIAFPGSTTYQHVYQLPDGVDINRLERALERVWKATPILRTRVISVPCSNTLVQVVCKDKFVCRHFASLESCFEQDQKLSWALGAPLSRFSIVSGNHLVWSSNHVVWDQWSRNLVCDDVDYVYQHGSLPPTTRPSMRDFIAHVCRQQGGRDLADLHSNNFLSQQYLGRGFDSLSRLDWSQHQLRGSRRMTMTVDLPVPEERSSRLPYSHSCLLLTCWTLAAAMFDKTEKKILTVNEINGRSSSFPGVEHLAAPVVGAVPLYIHLDSTRTIGEHAALVQQHTVEGLAMQHTIGFDQTILSQMESSAYWVLVNDQTGYHEAVTDFSLQLKRSRFEKLAVGIWPFYLTFNVHPGNTGVEIEAIFTLEVMTVQKATRLFACLKILLEKVFSEGGMGLQTEEVKSVVDEALTRGEILDQVQGMAAVENRFRIARYNPYSLSW